ncbi:hypothetical protein D8682_04965 [Buttiauxella sp. 3AFRM03]|uniref:hypothetical protein n=1 Tax=Buttiauxella sp. 3AFRM03 TaxID=2479367 RepID=UPI000EF76AC5|nr:hypothetical protein [Buttiauxella sp. 3AFRM03]AYN26406.1 hypothetical protein D8682_04965 [Buttiauxella sp. 3AFRM03]
MMQNIKNFKAVLPSVADAKKFGERVNSIQFFLSEDGRDWYECQALFADDTIKIMYDQNGVIVAVVDKPVPSRGNTLAVSMFNPSGRSVAEVESLPEGFAVGQFVFDGVNITPRPVVAPRKNSRLDVMQKELEQLKTMLMSKTGGIPQPT